MTQGADKKEVVERKPRIKREPKLGKVQVKK